MQNFILPFSICAKSKISFIKFNYSLFETYAGTRNDSFKLLSYKLFMRTSNIESEQFKGVLISCTN